MLCNSTGYFNNLTYEMKIANPTAIVLQRNRRFSIYMSQLSFNSFNSIYIFYKVNYFVKLISVSINRV